MIDFVAYLIHPTGCRACDDACESAIGIARSTGSREAFYGNHGNCGARVVRRYPQPDPRPTHTPTYPCASCLDRLPSTALGYSRHTGRLSVCAACLAAERAAYRTGYADGSAPAFTYDARAYRPWHLFTAYQAGRAAALAAQ